MYSLLQLNAWNGKSEHFFDLFDMIMQKHPTFVCLQEVYEAYRSDTTSNQVPSGRIDMEHYFREHYWTRYEILFSPRQTTWAPGAPFCDVGSPCHWGNMILWDKTEMTMVENKTSFIHRGHDMWDQQSDPTFPTNIQIVEFKPLTDLSARSISVCNTHGWFGGRAFGKGDCAERTQQSQDIVRLLNEYQQRGAVILSGDLNINMDTYALQILKDGINPNGNAIENFAITTGRTPLFGVERRTSDPHSSYIITSPTIKQVSFDVDPESPISDHAPMLLNFEIL